MTITYKEIASIPEFIDAIRLRVDVFIIEQGFQPGWEPDEDDKKATHFTAVSDGDVIATARLRETAKGEYKIERMVVAEGYRKKDVGRGLVEYMLQHIIKLNPKRIWLRSQVSSKEFYEKCGFKESSEPFEMFGVQHIDMEYVHGLRRL